MLLCNLEGCDCSSCVGLPVPCKSTRLAPCCSWGSFIPSQALHVHVGSCSRCSPCICPVLPCICCTACLRGPFCCCCAGGCRHCRCPCCCCMYIKGCACAANGPRGPRSPGWDPTHHACCCCCIAAMLLLRLLLLFVLHCLMQRGATCLSCCWGWCRATQASVPHRGVVCTHVIHLC
jgi:hypothetical protein